MRGAHDLADAVFTKSELLPSNSPTIKPALALVPYMIDNLRSLAAELGMGERSQSLLQQAFTHPSSLGESSTAASYERLEFLGDSILGAVISEYLFSRFPDKPEGLLSRAKAVAVSEPSLAIAARGLGLGNMIRLSLGEINSGSRERDSVLSDVFESLIAVVYLDKGLEAARDVILESMAGALADLERDDFARDAKSLLQELIQAEHKIAPEYVVVSEEGADHDKTFTVEARLGEYVLGAGSGKTKKSAQQAAAHEALGAIIAASPEDLDGGEE